MIMPTGKAGRMAEKNICRLLKSYTTHCLKIPQKVSISQNQPKLEFWFFVKNLNFPPKLNLWNQCELGPILVKNEIFLGILQHCDNFEGNLIPLFFSRVTKIWWFLLYFDLCYLPQLDKQGVKKILDLLPTSVMYFWWTNQINFFF